jgi:alkylhydroperoxidase family enzyme
MAWIEMTPPEKASGKLKDEFDRASRRAGKVFNILRIQSLNADTLHASVRMYLAAMYGPSGLTRAEREMLGTVVSRTNDCFY